MSILLLLRRKQQTHSEKIFNYYLAFNVKESLGWQWTCHPVLARAAFGSAAFPFSDIGTTSSSLTA
jgi:hypothetical protein